MVQLENAQCNLYLVQRMKGETLELDRPTYHAGAQQESHRARLLGLPTKVKGKDEEPVLYSDERLNFGMEKYIGL